MPIFCCKRRSVREFGVACSLLRTHRNAAGLTQVQCSKALNHPQSFMSDVESGPRRLDIVQLRDLCAVLGISLTELVDELEIAITADCK